MSSVDKLAQRLKKLHLRGYKALKDIEGSYRLPDGTILDIIHVQGDPFASPSKLRLIIPMDVAGFPKELFSNPPRKIGLQDYILRVFAKRLSAFSRPRGTGKSGLYFVDAGAQKVLLRSDCIVSEDKVEIRFTAGLPARGRSILADVAVDMLCREVPRQLLR